MPKPYRILLLVLLITACVKEEWVVDDNTEVPGLDPSFAFPICSTDLNLADLEENLDYQNFIYNDANELFVFAYEQDLFEYRAEDLFEIPNETLEYSYEVAVDEEPAINALPTGSSQTFNYGELLTLDMDNGEELDSVIIANGSLDFSLFSEINQDITIELTIPTLTLNGMAYQSTLVLDYTGNLPLTLDQSDDISGYTLDLSNNGTSYNEIPVEMSLTYTKTDESVSVGDAIDFSMDLDLSSFESIWGYFGQQIEILQEDTQRIDLFESTGGGILHFADPSIELTIFNSVGMDIDVVFNSVLAPDNSTNIALGGSDLTDLPTVTGASFPGDEVITLHTIDNSGTSPTLSDVLDEGPSSLVYTAAATTNPDGPADNFVLDTSAVKCSAEVILPLFLYADNFTYVDTIEVDLVDAFDWDDEDLDDLEDEVDRATLRIISDNGLPIDIGLQVYLADSANNIVDSLYQTNDYEGFLTSGLIDFSLPEDHPDYGRVYQSTRTIHDVVLTTSMIENIRNFNVDRIIARAEGYTNQAGDGQVVKFYPEYSLQLKLSGKVDFDFNSEE